MKKTKNIIIVVVVLAILVFIKLKFLTSDTHQAAPQQQGKSQSVTVSVYVVSPQRLENKIFVTGTLLANEEVVLVPEIAGKIVAVNFREGSEVSKGDLLVKINDADLVAQLKKLQIQERLANANEAREKKLLEVNGISQMEYDGALTQLNSARADIEVTEAQIAKTEIRAPFSGTIGLRKVSEGSFVNQTTEVASLVQTDPLKIDFSVPEKYSSLVDKGDSIYFTVQGTDQKFGGMIYAIEPKIDMATRTVQLRAMCSNKEGKIYPGAFAKIELILKETPNSVLIPTQALIPELKGQKVFVCKSGIAQSQKVETGIRTDSQIQITNGLKAGDSIVITGIMQLKDKTSLKIVSGSQ